MAEGVQRRLESMLEELDDALKKKLFTEEEVKTIVEKRTKLEYALRKRPARLYDFLNYIEYELDLEKLRKKRVSKFGLFYKFTPLDYAGPKRIHYLMDRALHRFPGNRYLWQHCIEISKDLKSYHRTSLLLMKALRLHPSHVHFWLHAVAWSFEDQKNTDHARKLFRKAIQFHPQSLELWVEWYKMEMNQAFQLYQVHQEIDYSVALLIYQEALVQDRQEFHELCIQVAWDAPAFWTTWLPVFQKTLLEKYHVPSLLVLACFTPLSFVPTSDPHFPSLLHQGFQTWSSIEIEKIPYDLLPSFYLTLLSWIAQTVPRCTSNPSLITYLTLQYTHYVTTVLTFPFPVPLPLSFYHTVGLEHPSSLFHSPDVRLKVLQQAHQQYPNDEVCASMLYTTLSKEKGQETLPLDLKRYPTLFRDTCIQHNAQKPQGLSVAKALEQCQAVTPTPDLLVSILNALSPELRKEFQTKFLSMFFHASHQPLLYVFLDYVETEAETFRLLEQGAQRYPRSVEGWRKYLAYMLHHDVVKATPLYFRAVACFQDDAAGKAELNQVWEELRSS
ncbi:U3 snoRNP protein [Coelomomyces lativittatus]|nr:U3 snoRNP protein [Coelomomyces lativittatus]KAJ1504393.1 U3 snoRNP protein [Coelomomyces lativittatus]KAJ1510848.1 U3 snoRNP protein [Coelomomyces lativittatus]